MKQFSAALAIFILFAVGAVALRSYRDGKSTFHQPILTFDGCVAAGYPVQESFPERCATPDGRTFARDIDTPLSAPAQLPTAGVCGEGEEAERTVTIHGDIPNPRCTIFHRGQRLAIENETSEPLTISLAAGLHRYGFSVTIPPLGRYEHPYPLDTFLAKGVHRLEGPPYAAAELWIQNP